MYRLWIWLAEAEKELGLDISDEALSQMKANVTMTDKDFEIAATEERYDLRAFRNLLEGSSHNYIQKAST